MPNTGEAHYCHFFRFSRYQKPSVAHLRKNLIWNRTYNVSIRVRRVFELYQFTGLPIQNLPVRNSHACQTLKNVGIWLDEAITIYQSLKTCLFSFFLTVKEIVFVLHLSSYHLSLLNQKHAHTKK